MTRRIDISISAKVYLPDDVPVADYLRAVANHLADTLPSHGDEVTTKTWRAGREVGITVDTAVASAILPPVPDPAPDFEHARFGDLPTQAELL